MTATTQQVLEHHLKSFGEGDLEGILEDFADESVLFTPDGILRGPDERRAFFEAFFAEFAKPGASFEMKKQIVEGETAYIVWSAETGTMSTSSPPTPSSFATARSSPKPLPGKSSPRAERVWFVNGVLGYWM